MNQQNRKRLTNTENALTIARWEGSWGNGEKSERIKKYKVVVME